MRRRLVLAASLLTAGPALAQTYPFEGRWREGENLCEYGMRLTATRMDMDGVAGGCRFTSVSRQDAATFAYAAQCSDDTGRYTTSGTIRMAGRDRLHLRDRLMRGQVTTYDRC